MVVNLHGTAPARPLDEKLRYARRGSAPAPQAVWRGTGGGVNQAGWKKHSPRSIRD
jgi:hypothetical protein